MHFPAGTYTALITPFRDEQVDADAFRALIDRQAAAGITGVVPCGTTGESATLASDEQLEVIRLAVEHAAGRLKVIAGAGGNSTAGAVRLTKAAAALGVDGTLQVTPYYNKPSQEGLYQHYRAIARAAPGLPLMLYSVPGRCVIEIAPETAARLAADCPNVTATKEAGGKSERVPALLDALPEDHLLLSGDDPLTYEFMSLGARGLVSVAANLIPEAMVSLVSAMLDGRPDDALAIHEKHAPLLSALMTLDVNPVPVKTASALAHGHSPEFRLPLVPMPKEKQEKLSALLQDFGLLP